MYTLKGWITTTALLGILTLSAVSANAGIIYGGRSDSPTGTCSAPGKDDQIKSDLGGIIYGGLTGIIFGGLTGIIYGGVMGGPVEDCGIIYGG